MPFREGDMREKKYPFGEIILHAVQPGGKGCKQQQAFDNTFFFREREVRGRGGETDVLSSITQREVMTNMAPPTPVPHLHERMQAAYSPVH